MTLTQEVYTFSQDYINHPEERTKDRDLKIQSAYRILTGETLRSFCGTCLIEALFKIRKIMEQKTSKYELKPGAVLEAFGDPSKVMTRQNTTDELAEWHLKNNPGVAKFFSKIPETSIVGVPGSDLTSKQATEPTDSVAQAEKEAAVEAEREEKKRELEAERALKTDELEAERVLKTNQLEAERVLKEREIAAKDKAPSVPVKPTANKAKK